MKLGKKTKMTALISPINPERACSSCGVTMIEWDKDDLGCLWPDGKRGCWSRLTEDGSCEHTCQSCGERLGFPAADAALDVASEMEGK